MDNLLAIEAARGGPFRIRHEGCGYTLTSPQDMSFQMVLAILRDRRFPGMPRMPIWKHHLAVDRWAAHHDLPSFNEGQRLAYLMDRYRSALVYDLQTFCGVDIGELWRARRWRTALDLIDHLPGHCWYSAAVANDEEHAQMLAESLAERESEGEKTGPPLHTWTPEMSVLTSVLDAVRHLHYIIPASQGDKKVKPPEPAPRPRSPIEVAMKRAQHKKRQERHDSLVARMLPHKAKSTH